MSPMNPYATSNPLRLHTINRRIHYSDATQMLETLETLGSVVTTLSSIGTTVVKTAR